MKDKIFDIISQNKLTAFKKIKRDKEIVTWVESNCDTRFSHLEFKHKLHSLLYDKDVICNNGNPFVLQYPFGKLQYCARAEHCKCLMAHNKMKSIETNQLKRQCDHSSQCQNVKDKLKIAVSASITPELIKRQQEAKLRKRPELVIIKNKCLLESELQIMSCREIAIKYKVNLSGVFKAANKFGIFDRYKTKIPSKYEEEISNWLTCNKIKFTRNNRKLLSGKELDFYFPDHNFAIEFNGDFWHMNPLIYKEGDINSKSKLTAKQHWDFDNDKIQLCRSHNIELFVIWEHDWNNVKDSIKQILLEKLI